MMSFISSVDHINVSFLMSHFGSLVGEDIEIAEGKRTGYLSPEDQHQIREDTLDRLAAKVRASQREWRFMESGTQMHTAPSVKERNVCSVGKAV